MTSSLFALLIAIISIQVGASLAKQLFPLVGAVGATFLRLTLTTLILSLIWRPWKAKISRKQKTDIAFYGISLGFMNLFFYLALDRIPLGIVVALEFIGPLSVSIWASRKTTDFLWIFLAGSGMICLLPATDSPSRLDPTGILFALGAAACWAGYIIFGQRASKGTLESGKTTALGMGIASLAILPFYLINRTTIHFTLQNLPLGLTVAMLSSAIPYSLEMIVLKKIPAKTFGILMSLEPFMAALSGFLILNERLSVSQWIAMGCIVTASLGSSFSTRT